jgi:hypothetical protein
MFHPRGGYVLADKSQGDLIIAIMEEAGEAGLTKGEINNRLRGRGCVGCDCENWMRTFLNAGVIEKCGKKNGATLYKLKSK